MAALSDRSLQIWRAIAAAGRKGISKAALTDKFEGVIDAGPLSDILGYFKSAKYVVSSGSRGVPALYSISLDTKVPKGESAPEWLFERDDNHGEATGTCTDAPPSGPNSVFDPGAQVRPPRKMADINLGEKPTPAQSARSQAGKASTLRFRKATDKPPASVDWKKRADELDSIRSADRLVEIEKLIRDRRVSTAQFLAERLEVSERTIYRDIAELITQGVPIEGEAGLGYRIRSGANPSPTGVDIDTAHTASLHSEEDFVSSLSSRGELYIKSGHSEMNIPLAHVRKFFRYLDGLFGTDSTPLIKALS